MNQLSPGSNPLSNSSFKLRKGALVTLDTSLNNVTRKISFQYNPETLTRTLQVKATGSEAGARSEALRLQGPPVETIKMEIEIDYTSDPLPKPKNKKENVGIYPQLAALETLVYPESAEVEKSMKQMADNGILEIIPMEASMTLLYWNRKRLLPVRVTEFSITEQAFDKDLNPIRAQISLSLRVLNYNDLLWNRGASKLFLPHHQELEKMAGKKDEAETSSLGDLINNLGI